MSVAPPDSASTGMGAPDVRLIVESSPHIMWTASPDGMTQYMHRRGSEYLGQPAEPSYGNQWFTLVHPDEVQRARDRWNEAVRTQTPYEAAYRIRRVDDQYRWHSVRALPVSGANGKISGWMATATDIHDYQELAEDLRSSERRTDGSETLLATLEATAPVGLGFVDRDYRIVRLNDELAAVSDVPAQDQVGRPVAEVVPALWSQLEPLYQRVLDNGEALVNLEVTGPVAADPGRIHSWLTSYYPVHLDGEIIGVGVVALDVTERKQAEAFGAAVLKNMAEGLYSLDANGCETFINTRGAELLGWSDAELHGKSMHALTHYQGSGGAAHPESECELLKVRSEGRTIHMTDDAFTRKDGTILPVAYSASPLYGASTVEGDSAIEGVVVVFRDTTEEQADRERISRELDTLSWIGRIREALDEDRFVLYSQPIVPLRGGEPSQELLIRMIGHDEQVILPGSFMPIAEKYGLINEIDRWVLGQAIRIAAQGERVELNVSAKSMAPLSLLPLIERELRDTGADPAKLVFEITETAFMNDMNAGIYFAESLAAIGCGASLDDFGTGFASFTYLKKLPLQSLKIDIEFVRDLTTNPANQHIARACVAIAQDFGYDTIAEGVEDEETLELLREYGVDYAQGYLLGRPAPRRSRGAPPVAQV